MLHIMEGHLRVMDAMVRDPYSRVSAHAGIARNGEVHEYVCDDEAAWHAGQVVKPSWGGLIIKEGAVINPNLYTKGYECEGFSRDGYTDAQIASLIWLIRRDYSRHGIIPVVRHSAINALHAGCPGPLAPVEEIEREARRLGPL